MPLRFSTGLRDSLNSTKVAELPAIAAEITIAFVDSGNKITDSANGFITAGIKKGDVILVSGAAAANNNGLMVVSEVAAGTLDIDGTSLTDEAATPEITIKVLKGGSFKDIFRDGVLYLYSGSQPATADAGEPGTPLLRVSIASGDFSGGNPAFGLNFGDSVSGVVGKIATDIWSGLGITGGTAGWFRFYANAYTTGTSTSAVRFDGSCATSGGQLNMSSTSIVQGATTTVDSFNVTLMASTV